MPRRRSTTDGRVRWSVTTAMLCVLRSESRRAARSHEVELGNDARTRARVVGSTLGRLLSTRLHRPAADARDARDIRDGGWHVPPVRTGLSRDSIGVLTESVPVTAKPLET